MPIPIDVVLNDMFELTKSHINDNEEILFMRFMTDGAEMGFKGYSFSITNIYHLSNMLKVEGVIFKGSNYTADMFDFSLFGKTLSNDYITITFLENLHNPGKDAPVFVHGFVNVCQFRGVIDHNKFNSSNTIKSLTGSIVNDEYNKTYQINKN